VHGQRTWTNSKSSYVLNSKTLREYRVLLAKTYYFRITDKNLLVLVMAEAWNNLWYTQWAGQWASMKKKREKFLSKAKKGKIAKFDFIALAKGLVFPVDLKILTKKQKAEQKHNVFTAGFLPGFTKDYLKQNKAGNFKMTNIQLVFNQGGKRKKKFK